MKVIYEAPKPRYRLQEPIVGDAWVSTQGFDSPEDAKREARRLGSIYPNQRFRVIDLCPDEAEPVDEPTPTPEPTPEPEGPCVAVKVTGKWRLYVRQGVGWHQMYPQGITTQGVAWPQMAEWITAHGHTLSTDPADLAKAVRA